MARRNRYDVTALPVAQTDAGTGGALQKDYEPLTGVFGKIIDRTWRSFSSNDR
jgi:hypothetical protein